MDSDERDHLTQMRRAYRRRLRILELQNAQQGGLVPPQVIIEIEDLRQRLAEIDRKIGAPPLAEFAGQSDSAATSSGQVDRLAAETGPVEISPGVVVRPWNMSFDLPARSGRPPGWSNSNEYVDNVSIAYIAQLEPRIDGTPGSCLRFYHPAPGDDDFGSIMQRCLASGLAGREAMLEGQLRTERVEQWAGLWLRADGVDGQLFFDNMSSRPIRGTTGWRTYTIITQLPDETTWLNYGFLLVGRGTVWADNFRLMIRDERGAWIPAA